MLLQKCLCCRKCIRQCRIRMVAKKWGIYWMFAALAQKCWSLGIFLLSILFDTHEDYFSELSWLLNHVQKGKTHVVLFLRLPVVQTDCAFKLDAEATEMNGALPDGVNVSSPSSPHCAFEETTCRVPNGKQNPMVCCFSKRLPKKWAFYVIFLLSSATKIQRTMASICRSPPQRPSETEVATSSVYPAEASHFWNTWQCFSECLNCSCPKCWAGRKLSPATFGDNGLESFEIVSPSRFSCIGNRPMRFVNCQLCQSVCSSKKVWLNVSNVSECLQMSPFVSKCLPLSPNVSKCLQMSPMSPKIQPQNANPGAHQPSFFHRAKCRAFRHGQTSITAPKLITLVTTWGHHVFLRDTVHAWERSDCDQNPHILDFSHLETAGRNSMVLCTAARGGSVTKMSNESGNCSLRCLQINLLLLCCPVVIPRNCIAGWHSKKFASMMHFNRLVEQMWSHISVAAKRVLREKNWQPCLPACRPPVWCKCLCIVDICLPEQAAMHHGLISHKVWSLHFVSICTRPHRILHMQSLHGVSTT